MSKTVIITGAARGIGRACAEIFAQNHYNVLINYHTSKTAAERLSAELQSAGYSALPYQGDVSQASEVSGMVDFCLQQFGGIDLLINNAGISQTRLFIDITAAEWDQMMTTNLKSVYLCSQAVLKQMIPVKSGKIINISSIWGLTGGACEVHYSAAKAGVIGLTKALAKELGPSNIQVNCIAPGVIATEMIAEYNEEELNDLKNQTPMLRLGTPQEIAACAFFLASPAADFLTGQVISPNGGLVI